MNKQLITTDTDGKVTITELPEEPLFDFKNKFYTPFNLDTREITYHIVKMDKDIGTSRLNFECSGFMVGSIELPIEFLPKLSECKLSPTVFARPDGTLVKAL
jgi:hypothetical protein